MCFELVECCCRSSSVGVNDSVASGNDSTMAAGDVTADSIKEHAKYDIDGIS